MKKNPVIFILYLILSFCLIFLIAQELCSQIHPVEEQPIPMTRQDTLRIIGDAVNKGIFYKESYQVQLKISERLSNDFESLYKENRRYLNLLDSLSHVANNKPDYLSTILITSGVVSAIWCLLLILLK
ncbi:MAG: hypothetical protein NTV87_12175 [Ignavibacteriae bacterium]|nr:hypothetical protein [Ignavibacteriota bacterium]